MRDTTERISNEDLEKFEYGKTKEWPYNLVNRLINNENKSKLPADWKHCIEEQIGFVTNVCGYKSVAIIKDMYKNNMSEKDIEEKYAIPDNNSIYDIIKSGINIMKSYNNILYHGFEFCNSHRTVSSEFKNIDFTSDEIKALNNINIWSCIQYAKNKDKIKSLLGWSDGKYDHFRKQMNLGEIDSTEILKKEDIPTKDSIESVIEDHIGTMELQKFIEFANQVRRFAGIKDSKTVSKSTKDVFSNFGYSVERNKNNVIISKKGEIDMEALLNKGTDRTDSLNIFTNLTKRCLIASGMSSINDIPLDKSELYKKMTDNSDLDPSIISTAVNDVIDTLDRSTAPESVPEDLGYKPLYTIDNSINFSDTNSKYKVIDELVEAYYNGKNGELDRDDMEYIISCINSINKWNDSISFYKTIDNFKAVSKYLNRITKFNIVKSRNEEKYFITPHESGKSYLDTSDKEKTKNSKRRWKEKNSVAKKSKANDTERTFEMKRRDSIEETEVKENKEENITIGNIEIDDEGMKKAFKAFLRTPAIQAKDIEVSVNCICPNCNGKIAKKFTTIEEATKPIYCFHCGTKLSF